MTTKGATVRARIDSNLKSEVVEILARLGMTPSEVIGMLFSQIRERQAIPFEVALPKATRQAMNDVENKRNLKAHASIDDLIKDMRA